MKKCLKLLLCLLLVISFIPDYRQQIVHAVTTDLLNDDFEGADLPSIPTNSTSGIIGNYSISITSNKGTAWVFDPNENYAQVVADPLQATNKVLKLYDNQGSGTTLAGSTRVNTNNFPKQTSGTVVTEYDFMGDSFGSGTPSNRFRLTNAGVNNTFVSLETNGNTLVYRTSATQTAALASLQPKTWYHVKIEANLVQAKYTVTISGGTNAVAKDIPFYQSVTDFGNFDVNTGNSSTSTLYLDNVRIYVPSIVPDAPTGLQAAPGNTQIKLSWSADSGASTYNVKRSTSPNGPFSTIASGVTDLSYSDSGLTNETTYYYVISGVNSVGEGPDSTPVSVTPSSGIPLPNVPSNIIAVARDSTATLSWDPIQDADTYTVKRSTSVDGPFTTLASGLTSPGYLDTKLANGTTYYYVVQAIGIGGNSPDSTPVGVQPSAPLAQPANLAATAGNNQVDLTWNKVDGAVSYNIKRSTVNGGPYTVIETGITDGAYSDTTAANGTTYYYVVTAAKDQLESMISNQVKATPYSTDANAPAVPNGFNAKAGNGRVDLSWNTAANASSYTIKRSTTSGGPYATVANNVTATSYTDTSVTNGTQYYYVVTSSNTAGESGLSNELAVIPAKFIIVAQDGSGDFDTVQAAVNSIPAANSSRSIIFIKNGLYREKVTVTQPFVSFVGESRDGVIIDWDDYGGTDGKSGNVGSTFLSQTVGITGDNFTASDLTILNSRAPRSTYGTAVALSVKSDQAVFDNVKIVGHQDTLYNGRGRQYFHNSYIEGDVDFIFGEATAVVFDGCEIRSVGTKGYVTAAAQANQTDNGYVFMNSRLTMNPTATAVYLGRPWKNYAKTTFINTWMDAHIISDGWSIWSGTENHLKSSYAEYNSSGPGANPTGRVSWSKQLTADEASKLTIPYIFNGWDPSQGAIMPTSESLVAAPAPALPVLLGTITDQTTIIAGWAEKGTTVQVKDSNNNVLGSAVAADGTFQVIIPAQIVGSNLLISSTNSAGASSQIQSMVEARSPLNPALLGTITDHTTVIAGWAEIGTTVQVLDASGKVLSSAVAVDGTFQLIIPTQTSGTILTISSTNSAGTSSQIQSTVEASKPSDPVLLGTITDRTTIIAGWAEKNTTVHVKDASGNVLGTSVAEDGTFQVPIPVQTGGAILTISSTNSAGASSQIQSTVEASKPSDPVLLGTITDQTTIVAGWAEIGTVVEVKNSSGTLLGSSSATDGTFQVIIPIQTSGTILTISSTNSAGKSSQIQSTVQNDQSVTNESIQYGDLN